VCESLVRRPRISLGASQCGGPSPDSTQSRTKMTPPGATGRGVPTRRRQARSAPVTVPAAAMVMEEESPVVEAVKSVVVSATPAAPNILDRSHGLGRQAHACGRCDHCLGRARYRESCREDCSCRNGGDNDLAHATLLAFSPHASLQHSMTSKASAPTLRF